MREHNIGEFASQTAREDTARTNNRRIHSVTGRTNHFHVTDEDKFAEMFECLVQENFELLVDMTKVDENGCVSHAFGAYSDLIYLSGGEELTFEDFLHDLQPLLPEDEAFIYMENESFGVDIVIGSAYIVTQTELRHISLQDQIERVAAELLNDPQYETELNY